MKHDNKNNNKTNKLPIYIQIGELLHREIAAGHWLPGERLPVESELAANLGVAVGTLRKALAKLEKDGLLERRQGSGTYVKRAPSGRAIYQFFRLELPEGGGVPSADTLTCERISNPQIAKKLGVEYADAHMWRIQRLRYLNSVPVAAEEIWIDHRHASQLTVDDLHESLYMHYREHFDFWISRVEDKVGCGPAPAWACDRLQLPSQSPLGLVERISWSNQDRVEEFSTTWFNPEVCQYVARWS